MALQHSPSIVTSGLVMCLDAANPRSYAGSGSTWYNAIGGTNTTLNNSPVYTSGTSGYFTFDGVDDYGQSTTNILTGGVSTPFTLEAVAMTTTASSWQTVLGTAGTYRQIGFLNNSFYWGGNGGGGNLFVTGGSISANIWYHLVFTFDGTTGYGYLNGSQTTGNIGSNGGTIGATLLSTYNAGSALERLTGRIALARVYNIALTSAQVLQNFNAIRGRYGI